MFAPIALNDFREGSGRTWEFFAATRTPSRPPHYFYVAFATSVCCNDNIEALMNGTLEAILRRRAVKVFEPVEISPDLREQILDAARHAPSSFNTQPYRFYWVGSEAEKATVANLCLGQKPAETASALVVVVADIGSLTATSQGQLEWMRRSKFSEAKIRDYERTAKIGRILFMPGPFGIFGAFKWAIFRLLNMWKTMGIPPTSRQDLFKWATKSTSLACENLMIAAEALGINTCPMEGFDGRRLSRYLGLSARHHEIVMVIAVGKKSHAYVEPPQWRRPLDATVTVL
jgi:nitroreductase